MTKEWKVGDRVQWEETKYGRRKITITLKQGVILTLCSDGFSALIDKGKWQRREFVYLSKLRPYADTTMPMHQP